MQTEAEKARITLLAKLAATLHSAAHFLDEPADCDLYFVGYKIPVRGAEFAIKAARDFQARLSEVRQLADDIPSAEFRRQVKHAVYLANEAFAQMDVPADYHLHRREFAEAKCCCEDGFSRAADYTHALNELAAAAHVSCDESWPDVDPDAATSPGKLSRLMTKAEAAALHNRGSVANPTDYFAKLVSAGKLTAPVGSGKRWRFRVDDFPESVRGDLV